ncbi:hypothetical protein B484DRAFT_460061 [Ochromonadaceae sp. CCMP2298]|nr:hypothetical protein B484DRAFT_460061 [Ochromonadaceae sp. CCMP2298]
MLLLFLLLPLLLFLLLLLLLSACPTISPPQASYFGASPSHEPYEMELSRGEHHQHSRRTPFCCDAVCVPSCEEHSPFSSLCRALQAHTHAAPIWLTLPRVHTT